MSSFLSKKFTGQNRLRWHIQSAPNPGCEGQGGREGGGGGIANQEYFTQQTRPFRTEGSNYNSSKLRKAEVVHHH